MSRCCWHHPDASLLGTEKAQALADILADKLASALDRPRQRLVERGLGFGIFLVGNLSFFVLDLKLEEFFLQPLQQLAGISGSRNRSGTCRSRPLRDENRSHCQHHAEAAENPWAVFIEWVRSFDGRAQAAAGAT